VEFRFPWFLSDPPEVRSCGETNILLNPLLFFPSLTSVEMGVKPLIDLVWCFFCTAVHQKALDNV
jgi:hypothetical protein